MTTDAILTPQKRPMAVEATHILAVEVGQKAIHNAVEKERTQAKGLTIQGGLSLDPTQQAFHEAEAGDASAVFY